MATVKSIVRKLSMCLGFVLLAVGGFALANRYLADHPVVAGARDRIFEALMKLATANLPGVPTDLPSRMDPFLEHPGVLYGLAPLGLIMLVAAVLRGGGSDLPKDPADQRDALEEQTTIYVDPKTQKKALKQASALAKAGRNLEAAEHCFVNGSMEEAAKYFVAGGEFERAAEIRHDQNRFLESAELYLEAGKFEFAGTIFDKQEEHLRSGEAYERAGNLSVAAEMYEKAGEPLRAADAYATSGFPRHAAKAYVECDQWQKAAACLEEVIRDETGSVMGDAQKAAELRKLVMMAGSLYERARQDEKAQSVLERGGCYAAAAEIAVRIGKEEEAAELFLRAKNVPRAAEVMRALGRGEDAARHLAEYHRDRGEEELAAKQFEEAGDMLSAGDLYRLLEQYDRAGGVYEAFGDAAQAAEMYAMAGDRTRAAVCYEQAEMYSEAAECEALEGNSERESHLLGLAGKFLRSAEIHKSSGRNDDAIEVLQKVKPDHPDFAEACASLGEMFRDREMLDLAVKTLEQVTTRRELSQESIRVFYVLATCMEATDQPVEATDLYEKILAFDYQYADASERIKKTKKLAEARSAQVAESAAPSVSVPSASGTARRYEIEGTLGRGGMGIVYKARDTVLDRTVAFKVLPDSLQENPQALKNFLREAKSAASLNHPNIVTVYDAGEQDGSYYIAMEYVDGNTLKEIVKHRGKISSAGIVHVLAQLAEALAYAHDNKIVHRDVKTANAMWTKDRKAKIMDFGLAKVIEEVRNHTTVVSGTPYYMSPEQTLGKNVDHRTDIYSLGVSVFEMATGGLPFTEGNVPYHHVHTPPPDPRELNAEIPEVIAKVILRCMQKDPAARFQSAREIPAAIKASLKP